MSSRYKCRIVVVVVGGSGRQIMCFESGVCRMDMVVRWVLVPGWIFTGALNWIRIASVYVCPGCVHGLERGEIRDRLAVSMD